MAVSKLFTAAAGSLIVVSGGANEAGGDVTFTLSTIDGGVTYTQVPTDSPSNNTGACRAAMWYRIATGNETVVTLATSSAVDTGLDVRVYAGPWTSSPLDVSAHSTGSSVTGSTGTTGATAQASEKAVGVIVSKGNSNQSAPTNSFTQASNVVTANVTNASRVRMGVYDKTLSATGTQTVAATIAASQPWAGIIATFKVGTAAAAVDTTDPWFGRGPRRRRHRGLYWS